MPRVKNYVAKTIYARVIGYGPNGKYAHIFVPSHWMDKDVIIKKYVNGQIGKPEAGAKVKAFDRKKTITSVKTITPVRNYNRLSCHIPLSSVFIGDIFEVTLDDHNGLMREMFTEDSSKRNMRTI